MTELLNREERRKERQEDYLSVLKNGGGDVIRQIFKESLNDLGIHTDEAKDLREDMIFLRKLRERHEKNSDVIWRTVIQHGLNFVLTALVFGVGAYLLANGGG